MKAHSKRKRSTGGTVFNGGPGVVSKSPKAESHGIGKKLEARADSKEVRAHGGSVKHRLDRPGRKMGGRCGADSAPLSSAGRGDSPHGSDESGYKRGGKVEKKYGKKDEEEDRARGGATHWIQGMGMKKGALHRELGISEDKKIPASKLSKAAHSDNPKLAKRARLAETLKGLHH